MGIPCADDPVADGVIPRCQGVFRLTLLGREVIVCKIRIADGSRHFHYNSQGIVRLRRRNTDGRGCGVNFNFNRFRHFVVARIDGRNHHPIQSVGHNGACIISAVPHYRGRTADMRLVHCQPPCNRIRLSTLQYFHNRQVYYSVFCDAVIDCHIIPFAVAIRRKYFCIG